jgi:hypothetical protein
MDYQDIVQEESGASPGSISPSSSYERRTSGWCRWLTDKPRVRNSSTVGGVSSKMSTA